MCNVNALLIHEPEDRMAFERKKKLAEIHNKWDFLLEIYDLPNLPRTWVKISNKSSGASTSSHTMTRATTISRPDSEQDTDAEEDPDNDSDDSGDDPELL